MNPEKIHDALTLLPNDLIAATDRLRTRNRSRRIHWVRWVSLAACVAILACSGLMLRSGLMKTARTESAATAPAESPAAAAPFPAEPAADEAPAAEVPASENKTTAAQGTNTQNETEKNEDATVSMNAHNHAHAETEELAQETVSGYCGNTVTVIYIDGNAVSFSGSDSVVLTDLLINLNYDPDKWCNCEAEFTVDTEFLTGIEVNLENCYARCERGQANLTEEQIQTIQDILNRLP